MIFQNEKTPFQAIKTRSLKSRKIEIFPKGLTHGFGQEWSFFDLSFLGNKGKENVFYDILERKKAFRGYKNKNFKKSKNGPFFKGVNPWFLSKRGHFSNFFFREYRPGQCLLRYSKTKKRLSGLKKKEVQKVKKIHIFLKWLTNGFVQKWPFFQLIFLANKGQENVFQDILERKIAFLGYKNKNFKKSKN